MRSYVSENAEELGEVFGVSPAEIVKGTEAEEERQHRERGEREAAHQKALADDLVKMAAAWRQAETIRAFLGTVTEKVADADRSEDFAAWFAWAKEHAEKMDPLTEPKKIAKALRLAAEDVTRTNGARASTS